MQFSIFVCQKYKRSQALCFIRTISIDHINVLPVMNVKKHLIAYFLIGFSFSSCISNKKLIYLQEFPDQAPVSIKGELVEHELEEYLLQYNDIIDISLRTSSPELNELLGVGDGMENQMRSMGGIMQGGDIFFLTGFSLDEEGMVELPLLGQIKLVGLSIKEAKAVIENRMKTYVAEGNYYVRVRLGGIRYSALGEFNQPGKYTILQNRVTIFEAVANAGDLTPIAKRNWINLIRQYPDGSRAHKINLINDNIMKSEFYFIRPNDVIYAEPMKVRELGTGVTFLQTFQLLISGLTVALLVINTTRN